MPLRPECRVYRGQADMCIRGCHLAVPSVAYSICDGAELVWRKQLQSRICQTDMKRPGRGTLRTTFATRDQLGFLADCSWFRRWTAADGPGMPKIQLAPPSALTCGVQHGQHEEVTKHLRLSPQQAVLHPGCRGYRGQAVRCTRGCHRAVPSVAYSISDGAELVWRQQPAMSDLPDRRETT